MVVILVFGLLSVFVLVQTGGNRETELQKTIFTLSNFFSVYSPMALAEGHNVHTYIT